MVQDGFYWEWTGRRWVSTRLAPGADLRWAKLQEADLLWADLRGAKLQGADLRWAKLQEADLLWSDLRGAKLQEADLRGAMLQEADLRGAMLQEADLRWADLRWADLRGADLRGADLRGAVLDFSAWSLHCASFWACMDDRWFAQMVAHLCRSHATGPLGEQIKAALEPFKNEFCTYQSGIAKI